MKMMQIRYTAVTRIGIRNAAWPTEYRGDLASPAKNPVKVLSGLQSEQTNLYLENWDVDSPPIASTARSTELPNPLNPFRKAPLCQVSPVCKVPFGPAPSTMANPAIMKMKRAITFRIAVPYSNHAKYLLGNENMRSITTRNTVSGLALDQHVSIPQNSEM